ncbi:GYDIA family GHMP kinase [Salinimicrobium oceani]|uniref:GHMP kinase n=1 Tax=Salinimicrobium oceani TaxID=2722702 RepID=A0ABX1D0H0_9FLAO|nr:GYDIA family GHMP kinase [Salinimicrobium oceani]NJW53129.1 GHMP kinase [Salinimicrobium oceani]
MKKFHSHGKLLLTGEYVVLDGATALALPTKLGQEMIVSETDEAVIDWKSTDHTGETWFEAVYNIADLSSPKAKVPEEEVSKMLFLTLFAAAKQSPELLTSGKGFRIISNTEFPRDWGLGTSSTLIANIARWLKIDAFRLLEETFGGSGYDVAVALEATPITFEKQGVENSILRTSYYPPFSDRLFFIHLNQKQNSRESIRHYREQDNSAVRSATEKISALTHSIITCTDLLEFELLIEVHENIISQLVGLPKVKTRLFSDYKGAVKSLGGWGGDFVLATGTEEDMQYFKNKGYHSIFPFSEIIL